MSGILESRQLVSPPAEVTRLLERAPWIPMAGMWMFGLATAGLSAMAGMQALQDPSTPASVFGTCADGTARHCAGLTFGGPTQAWFGGSEALSGLEGPLMAVLLAFVVLLGLMVSLVQTAAARIAGAGLLVAWSMLWAGSATLIALREGHGGMVFVAAACILGAFATAAHLRKSLLEAY